MSKDNNINNPDNFDLPEGYFESLNDKVFGKIRAMEELKEYPILYSMDKENPFRVPEGYFDTLETKIKGRLSEGEAKMFVLPAIVRKYRLAVAAVFVISIGASVIYKLSNKTEVKAEVCMELACLTKEDITNSKYFEQISLGELETVAGQEIQDSINSSINEEIINDLLQNPDELMLSDEDVEL